MKRYSFSIPYHIGEKLTPKERFVYYELCRLAAPKPMRDEDFGISLEPGSLVTSHYRLSKIIDYPYSMTAITIDHLAYKKLISLFPLEHEEYRSYYVVKVNDYEQNEPRIRHDEPLFPF